MTNQFLLTNEQTLAIDEMLRKIAMKKRYQYETLSSRLEFEDILQELWVKALEIIDRLQRVDMNLIAKAAYDKIVDLVRAQIRRPSVGIDPSSLEWNGDDSKDNNSEYTYLCGLEGFSSKIISPDEAAESSDAINRMLELFEENSKERRMLELLIKINIDIENTDPNEFADLYGYGRCDSWIAKKLGWAGSGSSSYQKCRNRLQAKLVEAGFGKGFDSAIARLRKIGYSV